MRGARGNPRPYRDHLVFHITMTMRPSTAPGQIISSPLTLWREGAGKYQDSHPFYCYCRTQMKLVKVGAKVVRHGRYVTLTTGRSGGSERLVRDNPVADGWSARQTRSGVGCPLRRRLRETMARKMTEWPSKRAPLTKIRRSDGCKGGAVPFAVGKRNDTHEFGCYLWNLG